MDAGERLKAACDEAVAAADLQPQYTTAGALLRTFCNKGAQRIAAAMGRTELDAPGVEENADELHAILERIGKKVDARSASLHALDGGLAFASMTSKQLGEAHGHICVIRPEALQFSGTLDREVPVVVNIGVGDPTAPLGPADKAGIRRKRNWNCRASSAFPMKAKGDPDYFVI